MSMVFPSVRLRVPNEAVFRRKGAKMHYRVIMVPYVLKLPPDMILEIKAAAAKTVKYPDFVYCAQMCTASEWIRRVIRAAIDEGNTEKPAKKVIPRRRQLSGSRK